MAFVGRTLTSAVIGGVCFGLAPESHPGDPKSASVDRHAAVAQGYINLD